MRVDRKMVSVSSACLATCVPATTALRWLDVIDKLGLVARCPSAEDRRRCDVELTSLGFQAMRRYLNSQFATSDRDQLSGPAHNALIEQDGSKRTAI